MIPGMATLPFLFASDDAELRKNLTLALAKVGIKELHLSSTFSSTISLIRTTRFGCAIIDKSFGGGDGIALAPIIKRLNRECMVVLISERSGWATQEAANNLGFSFTFEKGEPLDAIALKLKENVSKRDFSLSEEESEHSKKIYRLSEREREILLDMATGKRNVEIAAYRHISEATIKSHLSSIYRKLEVRNRVEAIAILNAY
jgi:DNA-binding NarL/FixJ family response regulator